MGFLEAMEIPMRRTLRTALLSALMLAAPAAAQAAPYNDYLNRLDQLITGYASFGFTPEEVGAIESAVRARPEGLGPEMYHPFIEVFERTVGRLVTFGFTPDEIRVIGLLHQAAPQVNPRQFVNDRTYRLYIESLGRMIKSMATFDFDQAELRVIDLAAGVAPPLELTQPAYDGAYAAWTAMVADLERTFASFGISGPEQQVLERVRRLRPRLLQVDPGYPQPGYPPPGYPPPAPVYQQPVPPPAPVYQPVPPPAPVYAPAQAWQPPPGMTAYPPVFLGDSMRLPIQAFNVCNRSFSVRWMHPFNQRSQTPTYLMLLRERGELVEVDSGNCQIRWLADDVTGVRPLRRAQSLVVLRRNGTLNVVRQNGDVFRVLADMAAIAQAQDYETGAPQGWELVDRRGGRHRFELTPGEDFAVFMDQAPQRTHVVYRALWRPL